jgi:hypothetical protein
MEAGSRPNTHAIALDAFCVRMSGFKDEKPVGFAVARGPAAIVAITTGQVILGGTIGFGASVIPPALAFLFASAKLVRKAGELDADDKKFLREVAVVSAILAAISVWMALT